MEVYQAEEYLGRRSSKEFATYSEKGDRERIVCMTSVGLGWKIKQVQK